MFLPNKYTTWYYEIIHQAQQCPRAGYTENHHILPRSLGGSDDPTNKVRLTAREHFVAHKLLILMTTGKNKSKMSYAYVCFFMKSKYHRSRVDLYFSSREYAQRKIILAQNASQLHKGKTVSKETVDKMLESRRRNNKPYPSAARQKHKENTKQRWLTNYDQMAACHRTPEARQKMSKAQIGKHNHSKKMCQEISARNKGTGNGRAKHVIVTDPNGIIYHCHGNFQGFCKEHNLPFSTMCHILRKTREFKSGATVGWNAEYSSGHGI